MSKPQKPTDAQMAVNLHDRLEVYLQNDLPDGESACVRATYAEHRLKQIAGLCTNYHRLGELWTGEVEEVLTDEQKARRALTEIYHLATGKE